MGKSERNQAEREMALLFYIVVLWTIENARGIKMKKSIGEIAIRNLAKEKNLSVEEIRAEIQIAIDVGMANNDPEVKANWVKMCYNGQPPTPEKVITYLMKKICKEIKK